ncbi:hypothetical protein [Chryseobacterium pennipullorum]|uniref:Uncharacterized protein n=1 Tax=Chryseobacterium pennipullorum TaxID=2258963 RepID=A0A3D9B530_9FLAO|nr:hypothetical protein [Chryseobacterium pennipullorum]REC48302.1 hypothetical protein DRF67_08185 [Chryseobacterium pennipullorum]
MNFKDPFKEMVDFDQISREIWADMKGEKVATNSIEPFFTNLWVNEGKLFRLLASSTDFNSYLFDAKKNFIDYSQEVEEVNLKEIPPAKIDNVRVKTKMIEKLVIREPEIDAKQFQNSFLERLDKKVWVNVSPGYIDPKKYTHHTEIGIRERKIDCTINIPYREYNREATQTVINEVETTISYSSQSPDAIKIKLSDVEDYMDVITYLFPYHREMAQVALIARFEEAGSGLTTIDDLMFFYNQLPNFALTGLDYKGKAKKLSDELLWDHFIQFLNYDSQLIRDVDSIGKAAALAVEPFRDKSRYAIRILTAISGEFVYKKIKNDPKLILHIYHSLDGESVYMGKGIISEAGQAAYGEMFENKELFVIYVTAFMQAQHAMDDAHQPLQKGSLFAFGVSRDSDTIERHCELTGYFMEGDPDHIVTLINTVKVFNLKTKEIEAENEIENGEFRPLDMLHLKIYEKEKLRTDTIQTIETDTEVPALFLYHIAQKKAAEDALRYLRVAADIIVISVSLAAIESGVSGLPLYAAYADLGLALSDFYIETQLRDELTMTTRGRKLLELWDDIYIAQGTASAMVSMLPKAQKALDATVEVLYTSRYPRQQESLQKLIKNTLYSFPLRNYSKNGLKVLSNASVENITTHASEFKKLKVLFVENAAKEIGVLHKGKLFFKGNSPARTNTFLDYVYRKAGGNAGKLEEEFSRLTGMAENLPISSKIITVEKFESGLKALQESNITAENAIDFFNEARIYFNHKIALNEEGKKIVVQIASHNCVEVVKVVEEFFRTGNINNAAVSEAQDYLVDLSLWFQNNYGIKRGLEHIDNVGVLHTRMINDERGILLCIRGSRKQHHVINVIKKSDSKIATFIDLQTIEGKINLKKGEEFIKFKYMKTN